MKSKSMFYFYLFYRGKTIFYDCPKICYGFVSQSYFMLFVIILFLLFVAGSKLNTTDLNVEKAAVYCVKSTQTEIEATQDDKTKET